MDPARPSGLATGDDAELVRRFQSGEDRDGAFHALMERHAATTHAFFRRRVGNPELAADLNQDLLMTVYAKLDGFEGRSSFRTWLFRLAHNRLSHLRRRWSVHMDERPVEVEERFWSEVASAPETPDDDLDAQRRSRSLQRCLADLSDVERAVVFGQYYHGYTLAALTEEIGLTNRSGARAALIAAQRKLRRCLERRGVAAAGGTA